MSGSEPVASGLQRLPLIPATVVPPPTSPAGKKVTVSPLLPVDSDEVNRIATSSIPAASLGWSSAPASEVRHVVEPGLSRDIADSISRFDGIAWAGRLPANGNRDATVLVPRGTDLSKPVEVIVYFHGNGGSAADSTRSLRPLIEGLPQHGRNAILIIPSSQGMRKQWMNPAHGESLIGLQDQAIGVAEKLSGQKIQVGRYTVEGFSGGGLPIAAAARAGELRADHINLFDSTYGERGDDIVRLRKPGTTVNVFYTEHNRQRAQRLQGIAGVHVEPSRTTHGETPGRHFYR